MEGKSTNYRYYIIGAIVVVAIVLLTVLIVKISSNNVPEIDVDPPTQASQSDTINTYSSTDIISSNVTTGKVWSETVDNMTTLIARPADNYMFGYWTVTVNSTTKKYSGMDTIVIHSEMASNYTPVFIAANKVLYITTFEEFVSNVGNSSYDMIVLKNDIDATGKSYGIADFTKIFDGNGHTIRNMTREAGTNHTNYGAIAKSLNGGVIKNLTLDNCTITDLTSPTVVRLGGFVGDIKNGVISNCVFRGTVKSAKTDCYVGGIVGQSLASGTTATSYIDHCTYLGSATGTGNSGLILGYNTNMACVLRDNNCEGSVAPIIPQR